MSGSNSGDLRQAPAFVFPIDEDKRPLAGATQPAENPGHQLARLVPAGVASTSTAVRSARETDALLPSASVAVHSPAESCVTDTPMASGTLSESVTDPQSAAVSWTTARVPESRSQQLETAQYHSSKQDEAEVPKLVRPGGRSAGAFSPPSALSGTPTSPPSVERRSSSRELSWQLASSTGCTLMHAEGTSSGTSGTTAMETTSTHLDMRQQRDETVLSALRHRKFHFTFRPVGGSYGESVLERLENFRVLFGLLKPNEKLPLTLEGAALARRLLASSPAPRGGPACLGELTAIVTSPDGASVFFGHNWNQSKPPSLSPVFRQEVADADAAATMTTVASASQQKAAKLPDSGLTSPGAAAPVTDEPGECLHRRWRSDSDDAAACITAAAAAVAQREISRATIERKVREHYRYPPSHSVRNVIRRHRTIFEAACFCSAFLQAVQSNVIELLDDVVCNRANIPEEFHDRIVRRPLSHQIAEQQSVLVAKRPDLWDRVEPHLRWAPTRESLRRRAPSTSQHAQAHYLEEAPRDMPARPAFHWHRQAPSQLDVPASVSEQRGGEMFSGTCVAGAAESSDHCALPEASRWSHQRRAAHRSAEQAELDALFGPLQDVRPFEMPAAPIEIGDSPHLIIQKTRTFRTAPWRSETSRVGNPLGIASAETNTEADPSTSPGTRTLATVAVTVSSTSVSTASSVSSGPER
jgi:hypothetical protein